MPVALVTGTVFWACSMGLTIAHRVPASQNLRSFTPS
jgi:hypothetical protein